MRHNGATLCVLPCEAGKRLDAYMGGVLPHIGARGAKRLAAAGCLLVNGKKQTAHYRVQAQDSITVVTEQHPPMPVPETAHGIALLANTPEYAVLAKPEGLHSAHVIGSRNPSLESLLPFLWPSLAAAYENKREQGPILTLPYDVMHLLPQPAVTPCIPPGAAPRLLTRLDAAASGLVLAAHSREAAAIFRTAEREGSIRKYYLALVYGIVQEPQVLATPLDMDSRRITRALPGRERDRARHTRITPLGDAAPFLPPAFPGATCVLAEIARGARHQIRVHLAHAGYPIIGDTLYGLPETVFQKSPGGQSGLFLHHVCLALPQCVVVCPPDWQAYGAKNEA